jgi:hypothetical protein
MTRFTRSLNTIGTAYLYLAGVAMLVNVPSILLCSQSQVLTTGLRTELVKFPDKKAEFECVLHNNSAFYSALRGAIYFVQIHLEILWLIGLILLIWFAWVYVAFDKRISSK